MPNLADLLTHSAATHPDRWRSSSTSASSPTPQLERGRRAGRRPAARQGRRAGRPRRDHAPQRPVLPGVLLRRAARRRGGRADERPAQGARGRVLPRRLRRQGAARLARVRATPRMPAPSRRAPSACSSSRASSRRCSRAATRLPRSPSATRRHGGDPLHLGHHRHAEGRRAHARQPAAQRRRQRRRCSASTSDTVTLGALPLFHAFGQTCALNATIARRRLPHAAPALRRRQGARDPRARPA